MKRRRGGRRARKGTISRARLLELLRFKHSKWRPIVKRDRVMDLVDPMIDAFLRATS